MREGDVFGRLTLIVVARRGETTRVPPASYIFGIELVEICCLQRSGVETSKCQSSSV